jgi:glycosyltransferase involved in cell wall biosynthesis
MLILLDCKSLQRSSQNVDKKTFILSIAQLLGGEPEFEWLFLVDGAGTEEWQTRVPSDRIIRRSAWPGPAGWKIWYGWQIPSVVRKYRPDLLLSTGNRTSPRLRIPQCLWLSERIEPGVSPKRTGKKIGWTSLIKSLSIARAVFTFSERDKNFLTGLPADKPVHAKILVVPVAPAPPYLPLENQVREQVKAKYAEGKEFFLMDIAGTGAAQRIDLLKAFSLFKKRQRSNMQLVLWEGAAAMDPDLTTRLATYKYRQDIHRPADLTEEERILLMGAAYGLVLPYPGDSPGIPVMNAWQAGIPVITAAAGYLPEIAGDAVLYARPEDPASLAGQLMSLYKDEGLRNGLIGKGKAQLQSFSRERSAATVREGLRLAAQIPGSQNPQISN